MKSLFRVTLRGMRDSYGVSYVVAGDAGEAYDRVLNEMNDRDLGFAKERALDKVELIAEAGQYPTCGTILYLPTTQDTRP